MARYCTNCGARLDGSPRFCGNCGKPCAAADNRTPVQSGGTVRRKSKPSGILGFFAGTAVGAFLVHLFGGSSSASAANAAHTEPMEHYHDISVHVDDEDSDYGNYAGRADEYEDGATDNDDWDAGDYGSDDSDYGYSDHASDDYDDYGSSDYGSYDSNDYSNDYNDD